jgi:hypothetical protein
VSEASTTALVMQIAFALVDPQLVADVVPVDTPPDKAETLPAASGVPGIDA